jgi:hypothetical protein
MSLAGKCAKCGWVYKHEVQAGRIVGLCSLCSSDISKVARNTKGLFLNSPRPPRVKDREQKIAGIRLFWWDGKWRVK